MSSHRLTLTGVKGQVNIVRIAQVSRGALWSVWGLCDTDGRCRFIREFCELTDEKDKAQADKVMRLLRGRAVLGQLGPQSLPDFMSVELADGIYEFKRGPKTGVGMRVLWFYPADRQKTVVCTHSFLKTTTKTPRAQIKLAKEYRTEYAEAKRIQEVKLIPDPPETFHDRAGPTVH